LRRARDTGRNACERADGYHSSIAAPARTSIDDLLAAATLRDRGLHRATDLAGGFQAWQAAELPVEPA